MKLLLFYITRSIKNQVLKLCKSWVVVFMLVCMLIGGVCGVVFATVEDAITDPDEEIEETVPEDEPEEEPEEFIAPDAAAEVTRLISALVIAAYIIYSFYSGDKSGSAIFLMPDVNLLFSAPMKPQSVLVFRMLCQFGTMLLVSFYLGFQVPNLHYNFALTIITCIAVLVAWLFAMIYGRLIALLTYSVVSTKTQLKKYVLPVTLILVALFGASVVICSGVTGKSIPEAAFAVFNSKAYTFIPIFGWIKGVVDFAAAGNILGTVLMGLLNIIGAVAIVRITWSLKVDFYEDAMTKSAELAEAQLHAQTDGKSLIKRKKDRADKLKRNGELGGSGASVFFFKEMYNRFRFAKLKIFTTTSLVYLGISLLLSVLLFRAELKMFAIVCIAICAISFFRALGSTVSKEAGMDAFICTPEPPMKKMLWALLAGAVNCLLDILPALIVSAVILEGSILEVLLFALLIMTMEFFSSSVCCAIDLSLPTSIGQTIKQVIVIMFVYFGLLPDIIIAVIFGLIFSSAVAGLPFVGILNILLGIAAAAVSAAILKHGKK